MKTDSIIPCIGYKDALKSIQWLCDAFGFEKYQVFSEDNDIVAHAELKIGRAMIMVGSQQHDSAYSKLTIHPGDVRGFETQSPYLVIENEDIDSHYARAVACGAKIVIELSEPAYGGKNYSCYDPEGHLWNFGSYNPWINGQTSKNESDTDGLEQIESSWNRAIAGNNVTEIERFMADDWIMISDSERITTKQEFLAVIKNGDLIHDRMDFETIQVQVFEKSGIVLQKGTSSGTFKGKPFQTYEWSSSFYADTKDGWKAIQTILTSIVKSGK